MPSAPLKLLFVDDEELVLRGMARVLRPHAAQWNMTFVDSAAEALRLVDAQFYDAVITDMRMPEMNGAELINRLMASHPGTIRIALSGYADRDTILQCAGSAHQYLAKPCDGATLDLTLQRLLRLRQADKDETIRRLVARCPILPTVPLLYSKLIETLGNPHVSLEDVGAIIAQDAAMSTQVLKLANSAFFGLGRRIAHPAEAALFLGVDTIKSLVLGSHIFQPLQYALPDGFNAGQLWTHSQACAGAARAIALDLGADLATANEAYVAGLLHDVGKLLLAANLRTEYRDALEFSRGEGVPLVEAERAIFGADHAEVGGYFLGLLGLPVPVIDAISHHHYPSTSVVPDHIQLAAVHLGNAVAAADKPAITGIPPAALDEVFLNSRRLAPQLVEWSRVARRPAEARATREVDADTGNSAN